MKTLSQLCIEAFDSNPGNGLNNLGVSNHYTPINNILVTSCYFLRNLMLSY